MSKIWEFYAFGMPKGQPRPRAFALKGKVRVYDPGTAEGWKSSIAEAAKVVGLDGAALTGAVSLRVLFHMPRPKRLAKKSCPQHTIKPDLDNLLKAVMDALTGIGVWHDDSQVDEIAALKCYTPTVTGAPGARITVTEHGNV